MGGAKSHTLLWLLVELNIVTFLDGDSDRNCNWDKSSLV